MKRLTGLLIAILFFQHVMAQEKSWESMLKEGEVSGHIRNYFMTTDNMNGKDYYADAIGGSLSYRTKSYKGVEFGISGVFTRKAFSADLNAPDVSTGKTAKWERELFDINRHDNFDDLAQLEEFFIKYDWKNAYLTYGKIPIEQTPLLGKNDGRMQPFAFQGGWLHHQSKKLFIDVSWIHKVSPRSVTEWLPVNEAIGLADNGFQPNGTKADYSNFSPSNGIGIFHFGRRNEMWHIEFWNFYLDKVVNTSWFQAEYIHPHWQFGLIYSYQIPNAYQERLAFQNRYIQPGENGQVISLSGKYSHQRSTFKAAYSHAFATGRYLFPKELGRDQFYTSIPRSRMDGLGDINIFTFHYQYQWKRLFINMDTTTSFGADTGDYTYNKYRLDDLYQINTRIRYEFSNILKGLNVELFHIWKENKNRHQSTMVYQKSNYNQINLITNLKF